MIPFSTIFSYYKSIQYHLYADDMKLYIYFLTDSDTHY